MKTYLIGAVIAVCTATSSFASTLTNTFTSFIVLGDSLSDNGNLVPFGAAPPPPYFDGRFSNGPVWNEAIAAEFTAAGLLSQNFAFGGATTVGGGFAPPSLDEQAVLSFSIPPAALGNNPLFSIWAGANDLFGALSLGDSLLVHAAAVTAANNVANTISALSLGGVDDFLVFNLPDLGLSPAYLGDSNASLATTTFNQQLASNLLGLETAGLNIIEVNIAALFLDAVNNSSSFGLTNATDACIANFGACDPTSWLFWDTVHPTAFGHELVQAEVRAVLDAELSAVPVPAALPLLFAGIAALGLFGRRPKAA